MIRVFEILHRLPCCQSKNSKNQLLLTIKQPFELYYNLKSEEKKSEITVLQVKTMF